MTTEMPTERDRLNSVDLESDAAIKSDEQSVRRTITRFVVTAAIAVALTVLLVVALAQGLTSALMSITGNSVCTGSDCVEVPLVELEASTGVDFPDGTTVDSSSTEENFLGDEAIHFEVRIPAGVPLPELEYPWESDTDSENWQRSNADLFMERGLKDIRWALGGWTTGVEANGDTLVSGVHQIY